MWFNHGYEFSWGGMIFGGLMMLVFWGGLIALIFWGVRSLMSSKNYPQTDAPDRVLSALEILDQRYARGEINRDEYAAIKEDIVH